MNLTAVDVVEMDRTASRIALAIVNGELDHALSLTRTLSARLSSITNKER